MDGGVLDEVRNLVAGVETPSLRRDRQFESISLQRRVACELPTGLRLFEESQSFVNEQEPDRVEGNAPGSIRSTR
jgi:hypothetical protein